MRVLLLGLVLISCARLPPQPWTSVGPSRVLEILTRRQCSVCHSVESVFGSTSLDAAESTSGACLREGHCAVPTLASMGRFRAKWLRSFLEKPIDVRPELAEQMIPHALPPQEMDALITGWGAVDEPTPEPPGELARGAKLFEQKQCAMCHRFGAGGPLDWGDRPFRPSEVEGLRALAPDLRHARHRLTLPTLERFIFSPASVKPTSAMPRPELTLDEAQALARYVYFVDSP